MTSFKEKPINQPQPLTKEAKDRIGNFYLSNLLKTTKIKEVSVYPFDSVDRYVCEKAGVKIPDCLVDKLSLKRLHWIPIWNTVDTMPRLILGKDTGMLIGVIIFMMMVLLPRLKLREALTLGMASLKEDIFHFIYGLPGLVMNRIELLPLPTI